MSAELWVRQHSRYTAFLVLLSLLVAWSTIRTRYGSVNYATADSVIESPIVVARAGHLLPIFDTHVPFTIDKRNGRYTLVLRNRK
jgi:hypothetical protein